MASRLPGRVVIALGALADVILHSHARRAPAHPERILVLNHLLLGDTLMLTALLKKLRGRHPAAYIALTCAPKFAPLYALRPYGVEALPLDARDVRSVLRLMRAPRFDLVLLPAENRLSLAARAFGARWIVAFDGDRPAYKNWLVDELRPFPASAVAWADLACLIVDGPAPQPYAPDEWTAPAAHVTDRPTDAYCVLHVGASTPLKLWGAEKWRALAEFLESRGLEVVLSAGPGEEAALADIDPGGSRLRFAGRLDLAQLWHLLAGARLVVCPDTGIAHLARVAAAPCIVLYGGGSAQLFGGGDFFRHAVERKITLPDFPCRNENIVFRRHVSWAATCARTIDQCPAAKCMQGITLGEVCAAAESVLLANSGATRKGADRDPVPADPV